MPDNEPKQQSPPVSWNISPWSLILILIVLWIWQDAVWNLTVKTIPYSELKEHIAREEVTEASIGETQIQGKITLKQQDGQPQHGQQNSFLFSTDRIEDPQLVDQLQAAGVKYRGVHPGVLSQFLWAWILPIGVIWLLWSAFSRRMGAAAESIGAFGKSKAKLIADRNTGVLFSDVAGCEEAKFELQEVVDFLKNPDRYGRMGAKIPKGILLVGPPGTGKTLLARAVAGEAGVPFFSLSGSDFVEMFVGVGAARVRDLFQQGKKQAPCIVFIDELDAIGRQRGVHVGAVNDEREQTLNQLLVEMDGFEPNIGVIILGATNRPEVLDRALLRPGRFDRQVVLDAPDLIAREQILRVHVRGKPLNKDTNLHDIARATPGFSGADLANAMNEAALLAARRNSKEITQQDLEEAVEKVIAGPERKSRRLNEEEKQRVAYHEVGHALVAAYTLHANPVHKISIIPRGRAALGYTLQLPVDDRFLMSKDALLDQVRGLLGGRAAEQIIYRDVTTGAENDLERATIIVEQMVCMYGMSEKLGLFHCGRKQNPVYLNMPEGVLQRDCSEETGTQIDREVKKILDSTYEDARKILTEHKDELETVAEELIQRETLDAEALKGLIKGLAGKRDDEALPFEPPPHDIDREARPS